MKKTAKKPPARKITFREATRKLHAAEKRIKTLVEEIRGHEETGARARKHEERMVARIRELEGHILELRRGLKHTWMTNDMLRDMMAGSRVMSDGRAFREHVRADALNKSCSIVSVRLKFVVGASESEEPCSPTSK